MNFNNLVVTFECPSSYDEKSVPFGKYISDVCRVMHNKNIQDVSNFLNALMNAAITAEREKTSVKVDTRERDGGKYNNLFLPNYEKTAGATSWLYDSYDNDEQAMAHIPAELKMMTAVGCIKLRVEYKEATAEIPEGWTDMYEKTPPVGRRVMVFFIKTDTDDDKKGQRTVIGRFRKHSSHQLAGVIDTDSYHSGDSIYIRKDEIKYCIWRNMDSHPVLIGDEVELR